MIFSFTIFLDELSEQDYRFLLRKHTKEFNVSYLSGMSMKNGFYARIGGKPEDLMNMLDFLASNGFTVELVSAK